MAPKREPGLNPSGSGPVATDYSETKTVLLQQANYLDHFTASEDPSQASFKAYRQTMISAHDMSCTWVVGPRRRGLSEGDRPHSAVSYSFLHRSAVCGNLRFPHARFSSLSFQKGVVNLQVSAVFCENPSFGLGLSPWPRPLKQSLRYGHHLGHYHYRLHASSNTCLRPQVLITSKTGKSVSATSHSCKFL